MTAAPAAAGGWESFAPAKLNLTLHVGPPGADGYHPLSSLVTFAAEIGDVVRALPADGLTLSLSGPFAEGLRAEADNLVLRAGRALAQAGGVQPNAALQLDKRLPIASGIGGGSADAAAALRVLDALWGLNAPRGDLIAIAASLGSDVPACVDSAPALMTGRGDILEPVELAPLSAVLVNPGAPAPTGAVYRAYDARGAFGGDAHPPVPDPTHGAAALLAFLADQRNDLTEAAIAVAPQIATLSAAIVETAKIDLVRLSGSGATVAAYLAEPSQARAAAAALNAAHPAWWAKASRLGRVDVTPQRV